MDDQVLALMSDDKLSPGEIIEALAVDINIDPAVGAAINRTVERICKGNRYFFMTQRLFDRLHTLQTRAVVNAMAAGNPSAASILAWRNNLIS